MRCEEKNTLPSNDLLIQIIRAEEPYFPFKLYVDKILEKYIIIEQWYEKQKNGDIVKVEDKREYLSSFLKHDQVTIWNKTVVHYDNNPEAPHIGYYRLDYVIWDILNRLREKTILEFFINKKALIQSHYKTLDDVNFCSEVMRILKEFDDFETRNVFYREISEAVKVIMYPESVLEYIEEMVGVEDAED